MVSVRIDDLQDPRLDVFRDLRANRTARDQQLFIAEGSTVVRRLFESEFETVSVLVSDKKWPGFSRSIPDGVQVFRVSNDLASQLVGFDFHVGILGAGRRQPEPELTSVLENSSAPATLVVAPHLTDAENVGALIRIGAAFGVAAVVFGTACPDPFSRRVLRVSMANGLFIPIVQTPDPIGLLEELKSHQVTCIATVLDDTAESLEAVSSDDSLALVFGNETHGLNPAAIACCDRRVTIPMQGGTDSLNVSVSAGIFLYWFTRGR